MADMQRRGTKSTDEAARSEPIIFSPFRLDCRAGQLTRGDAPVRLRAKTWALLVYLAERPGVLISRDELLDVLWRDVAVTPDTLTKSISELRRALGDESATPRFIETVHRRGVRFIAQVSSGKVSDANGPASKGRGARLTGAVSDVVALTSATRRLTPDLFVGRTAELRRLEDLFAKACAGERQMIFVTGPAGVGKTALVDKFLAELETGSLASSPLPSRPLLIGRGHCLEQHGPREPYMPVLESLERLARQPDAQRLVALLPRVAPTWLAQMPWLIEDDAEALRHSVQAARAERMLREFAALTEALTTDVTLVLVLEDLHWSDPSTVDLLSLLGQRREPARLLVIGVYRPAEVIVQEHVLSRTVRTLQVRRQCLELPVHELTEADVGSLLRARFPGADFPPELARVLYKHTDGNPLFVVAAVEHMLSRGWILDTSPGWSLTTTPDQIDLGVPDDARRIIAAQFERLGPADQSLLSAASVAGTEFLPQAITEALGWDRNDVEVRCEALARSQRFLRDAGSHRWPDGAVARRYAFTHQLYRHAVYEEIPPGRRQHLHRHIGEALETAYGTRATEIATELAAHFEQGCDYLRALHYLAAAAARARQRFARREAASYLHAALALTARLPDAGERRRWKLDLRLALAPILTDVYGFASEELRRNCERAYELCGEVGSPAQLFQIVSVLCHVHAVRADASRTAAMVQQVDDLARSLGTVEHRLVADSLMARTAIHEGRFGEVCRLAEGVLSAKSQADPRHWPPEYGTDPVVAAGTHCALSLWFLGHTDRAAATMHAALGTARSSGSVFTLVAALCHSAILALLCRDAAHGRDLAEQAGALGTEHGLVYWSAMASALQGWAKVQQGQAHAAIAVLEAARTAHCEMGTRLFSTYILAFLAEARLHAGELGAGLAAVDEGLQLAETTLDRSYWPELWRMKGELLVAQSNVESSKPAPSKVEGSKARSARARQNGPDSAGQAEACFERALAIARATHARSLELRAATSLARRLHERGRDRDAHALLDDICQWYGAAATSPDLGAARVLLRQLSPAVP
jgi:DNA-binding winged helix-turn-helix (wHTH) protein